MSSFISKNLLFNKDEEKKSESKTIDGSSPLSEKIKSIFKDKNDEDIDDKNTKNGVFDKPKDRKECFVCCSKKLNHIICAFCNAYACNDCNEKYILSTPNPKCMSCNKEWNYEFLRNNFTKSFMNNKYKKYKENILFDIEKSLLPDTQIAIQNRKSIYKKLDDVLVQIDELELVLTNLNRIKTTLQHYVKHDDFNGMSRFLNDQNSEMKKDEGEEKKERKSFIKPCPSDNCRGFLSSQYKCGLCECKVCPDCHEILPKNENEEKKSSNESKQKEEHKCNQETVQTIKSLQKECKNCPKCGTFIYKISGCNMMFCTSCHTAFDWKTVEIETRNIHNPHYFEFLRQNGREDDEIRRRFGGGEDNVQPVNINDECITYNELTRTLRYTKYNDIFRIINHIEQVEIPNYSRTQNIQNRNMDLRILYLENLIDESKFKMQLQKRYKKTQFDYEMIQMFEMFLNVIKDSFTSFIRNLPINDKNKLFETFNNHFNNRLWNRFKYYDSSKLKQEIRNVQIYFKVNIEKIHSKYDYKLPNIEVLKDECFNFIP
jgi:hypothetical protein